VARLEYELTEKEAASPSRSHGIYATPDGKEVWTCDVEHGVIYAFDVTTMPPRQVGRVETGVPAYWLTGTRDSKTLYVTSAPGDTLTTIDIAARKVTGTIQLPKGSAPKRMLVVDVPI
jgi:YVTN family beta-propeller protein